VAGRSFFGTIRVALLLAVLAFVALGAWLDRRRSTDWDAPLRVTVYPIAADDDDDVARGHVAALVAEDFDELESFFVDEAAEHGLALEEPVRVRVSHAATSPPPLPADGAGILGIAAWSLRLRYWAWRVAMDDPLPTPDVQVFALYHPADGRSAAPDSLGLSKGLVAIAQLYADHDAHGSNQMVIAHELLHTLGATDKYDRATGQPLVPQGLGDPDQSPRYPQRRGEIMAGRIATGAASAVIPESLEAMRVGPETAREIGWLP
jgi:hypothetical protein